MSREVASVRTGDGRQPSKRSRKSITDEGVQSCAIETMGHLEIPLPSKFRANAGRFDYFLFPFGFINVHGERERVWTLERYVEVSITMLIISDMAS